MPESAAMWTRTKSTGKAGFDRVWAALDKIGAPVNRLSNKLGSEAFWPTTLDKESDKAARILKSFCKDGFYTKEDAEEHGAEGQTPQDGVPRGKQRVLKKIPSEVVRNAKGLAIFTTMRAGLWMSGAGGSGVLIARLPDGSWSPPSGIMLHTAGLGFLVGVDIYDCVIVINNEKALEAFTKIRCTLGGEVSAVAGPVGVGGVMDSEVHKRQAPIFTYLKSRGFYAGVQVDGTVIIERTDENERFYGERIPVTDIISGKARNPPPVLKTLMDTVRAAEGQDVDEELLPNEPPPGDYEIEETSEGQVFGIPDREDPDPFGVLALQQQGLNIREAGTKEIPTIEEFEFRPSPTSPVHTTFRRSTDIMSAGSLGGSRRNSEYRRNSWRASAMSSMSRMTDSATQTDADELEQRSPFSPTFPNGISRSPVGSVSHRPSMDSVAEHAPVLPPRNKPTGPSPPGTSTPTLHEEEPAKNQNKEDDDEDADDEEEDVEIHDVQTASAPIHPRVSVQSMSKPRLVTVHKVAPPKLPPRNPIRERKKLGSEDGAPVSPAASATSKSSFDAPTEKPSSAGELSSEAGSGRTAESLSSFEAEPKRDGKEDDGAQDARLGLREADGKMENARAEEQGSVGTTDRERDGGAMRLFAERMRLDVDDEDDDGLERKTPGGW